MFMESPRSIARLVRFVHQHLASAMNEARELAGDDPATRQSLSDPAAAIGDLFDELQERSGRVDAERFVARLASCLPRTV